MFGNFFNFHSKSKDEKKEEKNKKNKTKKGKDSKKETVSKENTDGAHLLKEEEEEHFEEVRATSSNVDHIDTVDNVDNVDRSTNISNDFSESTNQHSVADLLAQLETVENEARRLADGLEQTTADKAALEREINALQVENDRLRANTEAMVAEKWELSAANADLQNRLQTMAMTYMQGAPDTMLQEELRKLQVALSDERKVTEKLSRNLELEKRRSESLEQKAKSANRRSGASVPGTASSLLPEEVRHRDDQLATCMEKFRLQCERLSSTLDDCEKKLSGYEIQEHYHADDLRKELSTVKRLLADQCRRSSGESQKLFEVQTLFGQLFKEYNNLAESMKYAVDKRSKQNHHGGESNSAEGSESELSAKLKRALYDLGTERHKVEMMSERLKAVEAELEALPLLRGQVEVYQSDFQAEREARQKIAGQKADLEDELNRVKRGLTNPEQAINGDQEPHERRRQNPNHADTARLLPTSNFVRETAHQFAELAPREASPPPRPQKAKAYNCPKCGKNFPILQILQNHVNACLDRED